MAFKKKGQPKKIFPLISFVNVFEKSTTSGDKFTSDLRSHDYLMDGVSQSNSYSMRPPSVTT